MSKLKYGLDVDSVLAGFIQGMFDWFDEPYREVTEWDDPFIRDTFHLIVNDEKFWLTLPILSHPKDIRFPVDCYITARSIPSEITAEWLYSRNFPVAPVITVRTDTKGNHNSKVDAVKGMELDFFVEDFDRHWQDINDNTKATCFLFCQPHNQHIFTSTRITNLNQVGRWQRQVIDSTKVN